MSSHSESETPRVIGYLALAFAALFVGFLGYKMFFSTPVSEPTEIATVSAGERPVLEMMLKDGPVEIELRPDLAPNHVAQILTLVKEGFYDGLTFHRVIDGFMAQTGDPTGTGRGGSELPDIKAEFTDTPFERGTLGMARSASPDSANSQFFITFEPYPSLDGNYTVFGEVISGMEHVDAIKKGDSASNGMVDDPDRIISLKLVEPEGATEETH
ncbi:MAG: peptidylprolyl isomerase [Hyphomicrobiaceae bacterium]|nr:peptidylprolyl isomerase [Hyphomicrobiaceae bacterium]MCC0025271.1 peptidylprolyl isomerase [Hyphomicrobiaceae bacterium]